METEALKCVMLEDQKKTNKKRKSERSLAEK
jgi:hypothetical protein